MLDVSDVRIYGIGAIILILSMGYFVYLLYQDVTFIKKELAGYTSSVNHDYNEDEEGEEEEGDDEEEGDEEEEEEGDDEEHYHDFTGESLETHLDSFMRPDNDSRLYTIDEESEVVPTVKKRRGRKQKVEQEPVQEPETIQEIE